MGERAGVQLPNTSRLRDLSGAGRTRVVVADDHPVIREGLAGLLTDELGVEVSGTADSAGQVEDLVRGTDPQMVVLDLSLGSDDGIELAQRLLRERPKLKIIVLTVHDELSLADRLLAMGVMAFISKDRSCEEFLLAVRSVLRGEVYVTVEQRERLASRAKSIRVSNPESLLSPRELAVLRLLASGKSAVAIAAELSIAAKTVHSHRRNICAKLGIKRGREIVRYAIHWARCLDTSPAGSDWRHP
jgi:two-component system, NarL family, response regulator FusR